MAKIPDTMTVEVEYGAAMTVLLDVRDRCRTLEQDGQEMGSKDFWEDGMGLLGSIVITIDELIQTQCAGVSYMDARKALDKAYGVAMTTSRLWTDEDEHRLGSAIMDRDQCLAIANDTAETLKGLIGAHRKLCIAMAKFAGNPEPTVTVQIMEMAGDVDKEVDPHELKAFEFDTEAAADAFEQGISIHNHMVV